MIVNQRNPLLMELTVGQSLTRKRHIIQVLLKFLYKLTTTFTSSHSSEILDFFFSHCVYNGVIISSSCVYNGVPFALG